MTTDNWIAAFCFLISPPNSFFDTICSYDESRFFIFYYFFNIILLKVILVLLKLLRCINVQLLGRRSSEVTWPFAWLVTVTGYNISWNISDHWLLLSRLWLYTIQSNKLYFIIVDTVQVARCPAEKNTLYKYIIPYLRKLYIHKAPLYHCVKALF